MSEFVVLISTEVLARLDEFKFERFLDAIKNKKELSNVSMNVGMDHSTHRLGASFVGHALRLGRKSMG